jgi:selenocysteine lyase/cysteine desulfurase
MSERPRSWKTVQQRMKRLAAGAFRVDRRKIHLNAMVVASPLKVVQEEIDRHRKGMERDPAGYVLEKLRSGGTRAVAEASEEAAYAATYLGLDPYLHKNGLTGRDVIAQTTSTTMGLGLLANGIVAKPGQEVLLSMHEFFATREAWRLRAARSGLGYREFRLYRDTTVPDLEDRMVLAIQREIRSATRILSLMWVDSGTGVKLPVKRIADHLVRVNAERALEDRILFVLDGVHGFGVEDTSFEQLGCHFFVAGCHKWIFGPRGTGIVCALPDAWKQVVPTIPSFLGTSRAGFANTPGGVASYEHMWAVNKAFDYHCKTGKDWIAQHTLTLAQLLKAGLAKVPGVRVITPLVPKLSSGIVCCQIPIEPKDAQEKLRDVGILAMTSHDADGNDFLRFSPSLLNTETHIKKALKALVKILEN